MSDNSDERELVLGNKQILAVFFVVAVLCGVFFAMGYVVGGNSAKSGIATAASDAATAQTLNEGKREEPQPPHETATAAPGSLDANAALPGVDPRAEPRMSDNPAALGSQPITTQAATPAPVQTEPPSSAKQAAPAPGPVAHTTGVSVPESGASYLQVGALERADAEKLVGILRARDFPAILAEGREAGQFRVLVGPYRTTFLQADAKARLKALSFNDVFTYKKP